MRGDLVSRRVLVRDVNIDPSGLTKKLAEYDRIRRIASRIVVSRGKLRESRTIELYEAIEMYKEKYNEDFYLNRKPMG